MNELMRLIFEPTNALMSAIPLGAAKPVTVGFLLLATIAVFFLKKDYVFEGADSREWHLDLRIWTAIIMIPYLLIYLLS